MSSEGCWRCGVIGHHRRDCQSEVDLGSATQTKREARRDHLERTSQKKSVAEKQKSAAKEIVKSSPVVPISLLSQFVEKGLQILYEAEDELKIIGSPSCSQYDYQLERAIVLKEKLRQEFTEMRDVVSHGKNYLYNKNEFDSEDDLFRYKLQQIDQSRQPLFTACSQLIANIREFARLELCVKSEVAAVNLEFEECDKLLVERFPSTENMQMVLVKLREMKPNIVESQRKANLIEMLCPNYDRIAIDQLATTLEALWTKRDRKAEDEVHKLKTKALCGICLDKGREVALRCGHQMCMQCLDSLHASGRVNCPFCNQPLRIMG